MTNYASELISQLIDTNWEISKPHHNKVVINALITQYNSLVEKIKDEMGESEFNNFMEQGKRMFAK